MSTSKSARLRARQRRRRTARRRARHASFPPPAMPASTTAAPPAPPPGWRGHVDALEGDLKRLKLIGDALKSWWTLGATLGALLGAKTGLLHQLLVWLTS